VLSNTNSAVLEVLVERQLFEPFAPLVVLVDPLVIQPLPDRPLPRFAEAFASLFLQQEVEPLAPPAVRRILLRRQPQGIHATGPRPIRVDAASSLRKELTCLGFVVVHAQHDYRRLHLLLDRKNRVFLEEIARFHAETFLQPQHVVWGQEDVHVGAALIETGDTGMTGKLEAIVRAEPGRVLQYPLLQFLTRVLGEGGALLIAHLSSPSSFSTIISRVADSDQTGSGSGAPVVGLTA
jgi:hypothetical protein